eukprot:TRINITY_DN4769_c0_g3_i1.p1 TRINITY_DN4769_c0_g3~~TRINITY_DN4769_c0_g3_i1.p1  ORF type:complete len:127 (-),score=3.62 TRINITY_DN4769_c0_g3_i1:196-576(-)
MKTLKKKKRGMGKKCLLKNQKTVAPSPPTSDFLTFFFLSLFFKRSKTYTSKKKQDGGGKTVFETFSVPVGIFFFLFLLCVTDLKTKASLLHLPHFLQCNFLRNSVVAHASGRGSEGLKKNNNKKKA